jgi:uncharacterized coiled-coil DUF342 family protein
MDKDVVIKRLTNQVLELYEENKKLKKEINEAHDRIDSLHKEFKNMLRDL